MRCSCALDLSLTPEASWCWYFVKVCECNYADDVEVWIDYSP